MSEKPEGLVDRLDDERMNLIERLADENERLREALRVCLAHWFKDDNPDELQENVAKFKELCGWENKR